MLQKNIDKLKRRKRSTWVGFYTRKTLTKKELLEKEKRKLKNSSKNKILEDY